MLKGEIIMIKYRPYELKEGIHDVSIIKVICNYDRAVNMYVQNPRLKGYRDLSISFDDTELLIKLFSFLFDINELKSNPDICVNTKEEDFEGIEISIKLVRNKHGDIVLEDIFDNETAKKYREEIKPKVVEEYK